MIVASVFEMLEKPQDAVERERVESDLREPARHIGRDESEKEPQGISVALDRVTRVYCGRFRRYQLAAVPSA